MTDHTSESTPKSKMRQYLTIAVIFLLLFGGISMIYKAFNPGNSAETIVGDVDSDIISEFENHPEDKTLNEIIDTQEDDLEEEIAAVEEEPNTIGRDEVEDEFTEKGTTVSAKEKTRKIIENTNDRAEVVLSKYMVIAGSYSSIENARVGLERTILSGFQEAEIVQFKDSKYHTVCALRSDNEQEARAAVSRLKAKKIDAFLHTSRLGR